MGLGDKAAAFALSERAIAANPSEKDAIDGPIPIEVLARVAAQMGEPDRAAAALQKLLSMPCYGALGEAAPITPALLRLDPMFDPLRNASAFPKTRIERAESGEQITRDGGTQKSLLKGDFSQLALHFSASPGGGESLQRADHKSGLNLKTFGLRVISQTPEADVQHRRVGGRIRDGPIEMFLPRVTLTCNPRKCRAAIERQANLRLTPRQVHVHVRKYRLPFNPDNLSRH